MHPLPFLLIVPVRFGSEQFCILRHVLWGASRRARWNLHSRCRASGLPRDAQVCALSLSVLFWIMHSLIMAKNEWEYLFIYLFLQDLRLVVLVTHTNTHTDMHTNTHVATELGRSALTSRGTLGASDVTRWYCLSHRTHHGIFSRGICSFPWMPICGDCQCSILLNAEC